MRHLSPPPCAFALAAALLVLLAACQPRPAAGPEPAAAAAHAWPPYDYAAATAAGMPVFLLDPERTQIDIVVHRDGPLARFGHDHVISVLDAEGYLLLAEAQDARADLRFAVERLQIDAADARQRHGLDTEPDAAAIDGTRDNLMQSVLDPLQWSWVTVSLQAFSHQGDHWSADVVVDINGQSKSSRQPFKLRRERETVMVEGLVVLRQTELGLQPFAALGGGLRVADPMEVHFHLSGSRR